MLLSLIFTTAKRGLEVRTEAEIYAEVTSLKPRI